MRSNNVLDKELSSGVRYATVEMPRRSDAPGEVDCLHEPLPILIISQASSLLPEAQGLSVLPKPFKEHTWNQCYRLRFNAVQVGDAKQKKPCRQTFLSQVLVYQRMVGPKVLEGFAESQAGQSPWSRLLARFDLSCPAMPLA